MPIYKTVDNFEAKWNGDTWFFTGTHDNNIGLGKLTEAEKSIPQIYPGDYHDWRQLKPDGTVILYEKVPLKCSRIFCDAYLIFSQHFFKHLVDL